MYFHSEHGTAELLGSERAHCGMTSSRIAFALLRATAFVVSDKPLFQLSDGRQIDPFSLALNTIAVADTLVHR